MHRHSPLVLPVVFLLSAGALSHAQTKTGAQPGRTNFAGTWRLTSAVVKSVADPDGAKRTPGRFPPQELVVTQSPDSIAVRHSMVDSATRKPIMSISAIYRTIGEWSGPYNSPPGATAKTKTAWKQQGNLLELTTAASWTRRDKSGQSRSTTTETWRLAADGTLHREIHALMANNKVNERSEIWTRVASDGR
jgi:hypothetical protein